jgi:hypothetical protein
MDGKEVAPIMSIPSGDSMEISRPHNGDQLIAIVRSGIP